MVELDRWPESHLGEGTEDWKVEAGEGLRRGLQPSPDREADGMPRRVPAWACAAGRATGTVWGLPMSSRYGPSDHSAG